MKKYLIGTDITDLFLLSGLTKVWLLISELLNQHPLNITSLDSGFKMAAVSGRQCNYPNSRHIMTHIKQTQ